MATISWKLTTGGGFGNAANWVGGGSMTINGAATLAGGLT